jgi:hypothetical protein
MDEGVVLIRDGRKVYMWGRKGQRMYGLLLNTERSCMVHIQRLQRKEREEKQN